MPKAGYLKKVRELCTKYNVLMICDEVQTGLGRTGKLLCVDHENVRPDIVCLGKALSGGFYPVSAILCDNIVMDNIKPGEHGSTYGGNALASAVALTAMQVLVEENLSENSAVVGAYFLDKIKVLKDKYEFIQEVRGKGLFCALQFNNKT